MGINNLQDFIETHCPQACKQVDLLKIARGFLHTRRRGRPGSNSLCLVVDAESCLDRLYGGYFSDWVCGGQWNRMTQFLSTLIDACHSANLDLVVFFNGALESQRISEWYRQQEVERRNVSQILKHVHNKATPPPKIWWIPPVCLQACLRMALRQKGVLVGCSMDDHHQEVIAYCRENNLHGLLAQDADYAIFDPPRYFSSHHLKLTFKGSLETKEYVLDEVARNIDLHPKRFCIVAALLGNHVLGDEELVPFFRDLLALDQLAPLAKVSQVDIIQAVVAFVRGQTNTDDLDELGQVIFKHASPADQQMKISKLKQSVQYYMNGTKEGFLKYRPKIQASTPTKQPGSYPAGANNVNGTSPVKIDPVTPPSEHRNGSGDKEDDDHKLQADSVYTDGQSGYSSSADPTPQIVVEPPGQSLLDQNSEAVDGQIEAKMKAMDISETEESEKNLPEQNKASGVDSTKADPGKAQLDTQKIAPISSSSSSSSGSSPNRMSPDGMWPVKLQGNSQNKNNAKVDKPSRIPRAPPEIMRIASERHQKGLMMPFIYQVLSQGEIKLGVSLEDESAKELPTAVEMFRPIRQYVYGLLFDVTRLMRHPGDHVDIVVKEWIMPRNGSAPKAEPVRVIPMEWRVPALRQLWLGQQIEDKNRRLRAFLTCMNSDSHLMLNTSYVPQHLLIMCCVLRYMVCYKDRRVLRRQELDAFLAAAVSPLLTDVDTMQEMKLPVIVTRGVQLASLFMRGVEAAMFANDACGAPIPWTMVCPWLYFDGKLFHFKLLKAMNNTPLIDMCDGEVDQVMCVERMRQAILEGIEFDFAKPSLPLIHPPPFQSMYPPGMNFRPAGAPPPPINNQSPIPTKIGRGRGLLGHSPVDARGGQLQIAGVVVGQWGPNTQSRTSGGRGMQANSQRPNPRVMSVGPGVRRGVGYGRGTYQTRPVSGRGPAFRPPTYAGRGISKRQAPNQMRYGIGRGGMPYNRSVKNKNGKTDMTRVTLEQRTKVQASGRGRGLTIENGKGLISDVLTNNTAEEADQVVIDQFEDQTKDDDVLIDQFNEQCNLEEAIGQFQDPNQTEVAIGQFQDADNVDTAIVNPDDLVSPDSGIQLDSSAT